ncbi:MAG: hypothetical protein ACRC41_10290, partial [Sarcina sp.]
LWLSGSNILSQVYNQNIFIDCEALLSEIDEEFKLFVDTKYYNECLSKLEKNNILMITGAPGVGKTTISKMIILYYANIGYRVRYTTNGMIADLKKAISVDRDVKEVILLDDCLGQCYFKMNDTQENEIISLIRYLKSNNKKKLVMNSRVTIFNEAKERGIEFEKFFATNEEKIHMINMDDINIYEKARVLYNHIYFKNLPEEYYEEIKKDKNYKKIISHKNYTPRIIEYVTEPVRYRNISSEEYIEFIFKYLDSPNLIWKDEYMNKLLKSDRILINTLFSLTENSVKSSVLEECFNRRMQYETGIDPVKDSYSNILNRLNKSMVKIISKNNKCEISVLNPSVNDYIKGVFESNSMELDRVKQGIIYYDQIERCYQVESVVDIISEHINRGTFLSLKIYENKIYSEIESLLIYFIGKFKIYKEEYIELIEIYILNLENKVRIGSIELDKIEVVKIFLEEPLYLFYRLNELIKKEEFIKAILTSIDFESLPEIYNLIDLENNRDLIESIILDDYENKFESYLKGQTIDEFIEDIDFNEYCMQNNLNEPELSEKAWDEAIERVENDIYSNYIEFIKANTINIINKINDKNLKYKIKDIIEMEEYDNYNFESDVESYVESKFEPEESYFDDYSSHEEDDILSGSYKYEDEIDIIFQR